MTTLLEIRTDVRAHLDEVTTAFWPDSELNRWINEGARDIARRAEVVQEFNTTMVIAPNIAKYQLPADVIRLHRIEYVAAGNTAIYPVQLTTYQELDQVWGVIQNQQQSYPSWACMWGFPPQLHVQLFPVPSQAGNLNIFYYRFPVDATDDDDVVEIPTGWQDMVALYCEYVAKRKDQDQTWQEAKQLYEERLLSLIDVTRTWHDQAQSFTIGTQGIPRWLYEFDG